MGATLSQPSLKLAFLWHMHQPDYRDASGLIKMPWVFLHAIKDYYDMPWMLAQYKGLKATFNLTASLIEQLKCYDKPLEVDYFLQLWHAHPTALDSTSRAWLVKICKSPHFDTMVKPLGRFSELYGQETFDEAELIDLEMQFMLSWCGTYLRQHNSIVHEMMEKKRHYTSEDKTTLLEALTKFVGTILPFYAQLLQAGTIAISTTPFYHPILPLLIDMDNVKKANTHTEPPKNPLSFYEDALLHVSRSCALYEATFGVPPVGFWPAEGAVDEKSVEIYKQAGIQWIATDEAILFRSLGSNSRSALYKPYRYEDLFIAFRDHGLSDLIGFDYRYKPALEAVEHFIGAIQPLATHQEDDTVFIILDGENAWEYYPQNAFGFFTALYEKLHALSWCQTVRMDDLLQDPCVNLDRLASGSWIGGDFSTWTGHSEKNRAWELLFQARRDFQNNQNTTHSHALEKIQDHFLAAQCSDWYWWYGDDHFTDFALEFDTLFRKHLIAIYELLHMQPPSDLFKPIIEHKSTAAFMIKPQGPIYPKIDGKSSSFFEWIGCGIIDESRLFSTMDRARGPVDKIRFGHNAQFVYIGFDGELEGLKKETILLKMIVEEHAKSYDIVLSHRDQTYGIVVALVRSMELAIPKKLFGRLKQVHLRFELEHQNSIIQTLPGCGALELVLDEDYSRNWFI